VNLVLLIDVSGSVDNYVNFIRKAARAFIQTVDPRDRVSIVIFNEDVKELATFSTDKGKLSESLDTFDAGGGTAYYDAIGYTLTDTLRSLRGERTAIVVLSDGDDNRSFLPFESLVGSIEESGALIYPLYVPTSLIAQASSDPNAAVDPLRSRYLSNDLTSKADAEGKRLAEISGGVYYPITQLNQIQTAYEDIVVQLRTSYDVTFRSEFASQDGKPSPRLKIRSKRPNTFVQVRSVAALRR
jgi:VWFA-related protein